MFLDFHLIVRAIAGENTSLVAAVSAAPVSRWGSRFDRFAGGRDLEGVFARLHGVGLERDRTEAFYLRLDAEDSEPPSRDVILGKSTPSRHREIREQLFDLLFPADSSAYQLLGRSCQQANAEGLCLRLKLELDPRLANLPWEWSTCPRHGSWAEDINKAKISWLRYFGDLRQSPDRRRSVEGTPCVVLIVASPRDLTSPALDSSFEGERQQIGRILTSLGISHMTIEGADTLNQMRHRLPTLELGGRPILGLHFIGHGGIDQRGSYLLGEDESRNKVPISEAELRATLDRCQSLRWIFFNACNTAHSPVGSPLAGLSTSMVVLGNVPTVVAYQRPVGTEEAEGVGTELYKLILEHRLSFEDALRDLRIRFDHPGGLVVAARSVDGRIPSWFPNGVEEPSADPAPEPSPARNPVSHREPPHQTEERADPTGAEPVDDPDQAKMVEVPGGWFRPGFVAEEIDRLIEQFRADRLAIDERGMRQLLARGSDQEIELAPFRVDRTPVTNARFGAFVAATGYLTEAERTRSRGVWHLFDRPDREDHPVVHVSYYDALQFCRWAGKRLLTAEEWMLAYRGTEGRLYPWGDIFDPGCCNSSDQPHDHQTTTVTLHPRGASPQGCLDLVGNVEEWTTTNDPDGSLRTLGGSWAMRCQVYGLPVFQRFASPHFSSDELGFRCARDLAD